MFHMTPEATRDFLRDAPVVHVATTDHEGRPILRTVHGILFGEAVAFHGSPVGEKQEAIGRPAVIGAEEIVASIPSYFTDPERACPATTYYRSVQVHGCIEPVTDPEAKAHVLRLLMQRFQPEGGHVPITADHPLYAKAVAGIQVLQVPFGQVDGKAKLGQNLRPDQLCKVVTQLWQRGAGGDARAVDLVRKANPAMPLPEFLKGPAGMVLRCDVSTAEVQAVCGDTADSDAHVTGIRTGLAVPTAVWVGAEDPDGRLMACLAGASDGMQVRILAAMVTGQVDGDLLLARMTALLLDHPALRHAGGRHVPLGAAALPVEAV
jgi:nitroimidazol reductase NimA-like FMN-containing flavoprotein (pyridoxamine 5'-phosphate oxidase superfamily)